MKRAVSATLASRLYAEYSWEILTSIAQNIEKTTNPLFLERDLPAGRQELKILLVLITSNRGLCGAYNAQIIKKALQMVRGMNAKLSLVTIGKKGDAAMRRVDQNVLASFLELPDLIKLSDVMPISKLVIDEYSVGNFDQVLIAYTDFISALTQKPNIKQLLPISKQEVKEMADEFSPRLNKERGQGVRSVDYLFEGDFNALIQSLAEKITKTQIYQMLLESNASEQSSRMMAMKNASEASGEMIDDLTLMFNKARQSNITREISEISAGMASVS